MSGTDTKILVDGTSPKEKTEIIKPGSTRRVGGKSDCAHLASARKTMGTVFRNLTNKNDMHCNATLGCVHLADTAAVHQARGGAADQPKMPECPIQISGA